MVPYENEKLPYDKIHSFNNGTYLEKDFLHWDFPLLMKNIKNGLQKTLKKYDGIASIGIDTFGLDYGAIDKNAIGYSEAINKKIDEYVSQLAEKCATLKSEGKLNEQSEITVKYINERYLDRDSRSDIYEIRNQVRESRGVGERLGEDIQRGQREKAEGKGGQISRSSNVNTSEEASFGDSKNANFDEWEERQGFKDYLRKLTEKKGPGLEEAGGVFGADGLCRCGGGKTWLDAQYNICEIFHF